MPDGVPWIFIAVPDSASGDLFSESVVGSLSRYRGALRIAYGTVVLVVTALAVAESFEAASFTFVVTARSYRITVLEKLGILLGSQHFLDLLEVFLTVGLGFLSHFFAAETVLLVLSVLLAEASAILLVDSVYLLLLVGGEVEIGEG